MSEYKKSNGEEIRIFYVELGATANDVIQVRKDHEDKPLAVFDKYNYLKGSKLVDDTSLQLLLSDTGYNNYNNKIDTIILVVK